MPVSGVPNSHFTTIEQPYGKLEKYNALKIFITIPQHLLNNLTVIIRHVHLHYIHPYFQHRTQVILPNAMLCVEMFTSDTQFCGLYPKSILMKRKMNRK